MFWSQVDDNSINDLLLKEDVTLEDVLDHESILQECKIQNEKLIKFFCIKNNFSKLLNYVLVTPSEDIDEKIRFKYPSLVCEILTSDVSEINEFLVNGYFKEESSETTFFVDQVFSNIDIDVSMNPLTISYIVKILLNILKYNNDKVMNHILKKENSLDLFLKQVENNAVAVFFTEFLMCDEDCTATRIQWLRQNEFVYKCAQMFTISEYRNNAVQELLCEVIMASWKFFANKDIRDEIRNQLSRQSFLDLIFSYLSNTNGDSNLITGCLKVVRTIVDFENESDNTKIECIKEMFLKHLNSIKTLLSSPPKQMYDPMYTTIGAIQPFGPARLEIVYLIESLLKLNDSEINNAIGQTNILNTLLTFVSQYKWNTMFQLGLLKIFDILFADLSTKCQYKELLKNLVTVYDIYHWFIVIIQETTESEKPRPGCIGMLWKLGNHLDNLWGSKIVDEIIKNKEPEDCDNWSKVVNDHLQPRNAKNIVVPPKMDSAFKDIISTAVDIDEDSFALSNNLDKISEFCRNKSDNLDDIFGTSAIDDDDDWIDNQLKMPEVPIDDTMGSYKNTSAVDNDDDDDQDSSSDDEDSPAVIRQRPSGTECKYILSDLTLDNLYDVPDFSGEPLSDLQFDDPWKSQSPSKPSVQDNWANFNAS